jgi:hypothetical protein
MQIFVIFNISDRAKLGTAVREAFPANHLELAGGEWLVAAQMTSKEVSDRLQITNGENGSGIVFAMGGYFGRADAAVWEWVALKAEQNGS